MIKMLEEEVKKEKASWNLIKSNFVADNRYLNELGLDEDLKRDIKNE